MHDNTTRLVKSSGSVAVLKHVVCAKCGAILEPLTAVNPVNLCAAPLWLKYLGTNSLFINHTSIEFYSIATVVSEYQVVQA